MTDQHDDTPAPLEYCPYCDASEDDDHKDTCPLSCDGWGPSVKEQGEEQ